MLETARLITDACGCFPFVYRAGVWKPRTSPNTFQGAGETGLAWLREVKESSGVPVATEVATPEQVRMALEAGIDCLWIGARTSANPVTVSSLASQIGDLSLVIGHLKAVLIKNPVNADAKLWLGNIERLEKAGVPVIAVHRGCNHKPCWAMAHEVRLARPDIPMLLDPSHMSGDAEKVPELMGKVEELGLNGAMIEVHAHPEDALSDNAQQITPACLRKTIDPILSRLSLASLNCPSDGSKELNWLRAEMDELDERLWETLSERMEKSRQIGVWKKAHGMTPLQPERYRHVLEQAKAFARTRNLSSGFVERLFELIHEESLKRQS